MNRGKVAVGLSGGVDSAVGALLLKEAGYEVIGVHLYCYPAKSEYSRQLSVISKKEEEELKADWIKKNGCRADEDRQAALKTALELDIPFKVLDFSEEYNSRVIEYFYREYQAGRTPNPDVLCNSEIKFGLFLKWALENDFDYVAMGHYAGIRRCYGDTVTQLHIPKDKHKDQTYFLWKLTQKELAHVLFPLGDLLKTEVRKIAADAGLSVASRPDSQGICFVGNVPARKFLARKLEVKRGEVKNIKGEVIGSHDGIWFYTIGQRGGWEIFPAAQRKIAVIHLPAGRQGVRSDTPALYVISKDTEKNELTVAIEGEEKRESFEMSEVNWIGGAVPERHNVTVRIRHGGELIAAEMRLIGQMGRIGVKMEKEQRGVATGQSAVFYTQDGECLGGGVID